VQGIQQDIDGKEKVRKNNEGKSVQSWEWVIVAELYEQAWNKDHTDWGLV
jgi:hypothetical protein